MIQKNILIWSDDVKKDVLIMQEEKIKKYLIFTLLFQIIILFVGIVPTSSISIGDKLEIVILTNIGLLSGTIAVIYSINKEH